MMSLFNYSTQCFAITAQHIECYKYVIVDTFTMQSNLDAIACVKNLSIVILICFTCAGMGCMCELPYILIYFPYILIYLPYILIYFCSLGSHKMKGSAYSTLVVPTTAVPIPLTLHSIFLVHLAELCKQ